MPSRVASSLLASLQSSAHNLITYTVQEYENVVVRLCRSPSIRWSMKLSIASNLLTASTFNKISMQSSLEYAYFQAWEVRNIFKNAAKPLVDDTDPFHVVLPHIIGQSSPSNAIPNELFERGLQLIKLLSCYGGLIENSRNSNIEFKDIEKELKDLINDSDSEATLDIKRSIQSIRYRLLLGGIESLYSKRSMITYWKEILYDSCVYSYNCTMCRSSPSEIDYLR